jgi:DNA-binding NarL/FixJ family response regulator
MMEWVDRLQRDHDNVRAAIDWSIESRQTDSALRVAGALFLFWLYGNHLPEGRRRVDTILALEGGDRGLRARALSSAAGAAAFLLDDQARLRAFAEEAIALAREGDDTRTVGRGLTLLGFATLYYVGEGSAPKPGGEILLPGDSVAGRALFEQGAAAAERSGDVAFVCLALVGLVIVETALGEWVRARDAAQRAVEVARASGHPSWLAQTLCWAGCRAVWWGELSTARRCVDESISIARGIDDHWFLSFALAFRGLVEIRSGRHEEGRRDVEEAIAIARSGGLLFQVGVADVVSAEGFYAVGELDGGATAAEEAVAIFRIADYPFCVAYGLSFLALFSEARQDADAARRQAEETLTIARANGFRREEGSALLTIARLEHADGSVDQADAALHEALGIFTRGRFPLEIITTLEHIATIATLKESHDEAARLFAAAQAARAAIGYPREPVRVDEYESSVTAVREGLGADAFDAAWMEGAALTLDEAVAYATRARGERKRPSHGWASVTPTELDVVRLVREGLTNPQIAERMFISKNTVMTHLSHVFAKLGVSTRAELASEATRRGL